MTVLRRLLTFVVALLALIGTASIPAAAHPLGNFTVNRYTGLLVTPDGLVVDHVMDLAEIPTAQLGERLEDLDALAAAECAEVRQGLRVVVAGGPLALTPAATRAMTRAGEGGLPITRITCRFRGPVQLGPGATEILVEDGTAPRSVGWREITAVGDRMTLLASDVPEQSVSDRLQSYPRDLLSSPLSVTTATLTVAPGGPAAVLPGTAGDAGPASSPGWLTPRTTDLLGSGGLLAGALAMLLALVLGAAHALRPGHGKTVMAFYLSQRGDSSWRSAAAVGGAVTLAHTGSVLVLGVLATVSAQFVPARVYPWLSLATALLILALGVFLLRNVRRGGHEHGNGHGHGHGHVHGHGHGHGHVHGHGHGHAHGHGDHHDHKHTHAHAHGQADEEPTAASHVVASGTATTDVLVATRPAPATTAPVTEASRRFGVWTMGLVGGLLPSPSALILLLAAAAVGRSWFGVLLVVCFGLGMATTLAVVGLLARDLLRRVERLVTRRGLFGGQVRTVVGYAAAVSVCLIGTGLAVRTLTSLL